MDASRYAEGGSLPIGLWEFTQSTRTTAEPVFALCPDGVWDPVASIAAATEYIRRSYGLPKTED